MAVTSEDAEARGEANSSEEEYNIEEATQDTLFLQRQGTTPEQTRDDRRAPPAGEETNKWQDDENENDSDDEVSQEGSNEPRHECVSERIFTCRNGVANKVSHTPHKPANLPSSWLVFVFVFFLPLFF